MEHKKMLTRPQEIIKQKSSNQESSSNTGTDLDLSLGNNNTHLSLDNNQILTSHATINTFSYIGYAMICLMLSTIALDSFAVDLDKFGKGVTQPMVKFATEYWVYGAGIGGIATALLSEGDGRVRIIRGGTVFLGSSAICMGILAAMT